MRIQTYPIAADIKTGDKWIGTKEGTNATKNFSVKEVIDFLNETSSVDSQTLRYKFQFLNLSGVGPDLVREKGTISFKPQLPAPPGKTISLNSDLEILLSNYSLKYLSQPLSPDISSFYTKLIDSRVFLTNTEDITQFGVYTWANAVQNAAEPNFTDVSLTKIQGQGDLIAGKQYFISLLQWNPANDTDKNFVFDQAIPSAVWTVQHNLNKFCSVTVVNSFDETVFGNVEYIDKNNLTITFASPFSGEAFCN
jgi:hypothetical protein